MTNTKMEKRLLSNILCILVLTALVVGGFFTVIASNPEVHPVQDGKSNTPIPSVYNPHAPIRIDGFAGFTPANGVVGGTGFPSDPFIIEGWDINASLALAGIWITNTSVYFEISLCFIHDYVGVGSYGIICQNICNGFIKDNIVRYCYGGVDLQSSNCNIVTNNNFYKLGAGAYLSSSMNNIISNNNISTCFGGISLAYSSNNNTISGNYINRTWEGCILIHDSEKNKILGNILMAGNFGISIYNAPFNEIRRNYISLNLCSGFTAESSNYNLITENNAYNNKNYSFMLWNCVNNAIHHNNIINNIGAIKQAADNNNMNFWNTSTEGNYWSDWTGPDTNADGIVDNPYTLEGSAGAKDYYPLVAPIGKYMKHGPIRINSDSDFDLQFPGRFISGFDINGTIYGNCIYIGNCSIPFMVKDCYLHHANGRNDTFFYNSGLFIYNSSNGQISNNIANSNYNTGILLSLSTSNTVFNNTASSNIYGVTLEYSKRNIISDNTVNFNFEGIYLSNSDNNLLSINTAVSNLHYGIRLDLSNSNTISNNTISSNMNGIVIYGSTKNIISDNTVYFNSGGGIYLYLSDNNKIFKNNASSNSDGIITDNCASNTISNNVVYSNNHEGISIGGNSHIITNNTIISNNHNGFYLDNSNSNIIFNNTICLNKWTGIYFWSSLNNIIFYNNISFNNNYGIENHDFSCEYNYIHHNLFIGNGDCSKQAYDNSSLNIWNTSTEGNYWSDWTGPDNDSDSIVDFPYVLEGGASAKDYYPIAYSSSGKYKPHLPIRIYSDSDFDAQFPGRIISGFDIDGTGYGYCIFIGNCSAPFTIENNYLHNASGRYIQYFYNTGIYLYKSSNGAISNNNCSRNSHYGIFIEQYSYNNTLTNNNCSENDDIGINFQYGSNGNRLSGNKCYNNRLYGIMFITSDNNILTGNICSEHTQYGIYFLCSHNNTLIGNTCSENHERGIYITSNSKYNRIHHNIFIYNNGGGTQAYDEDGTNFWNTSTEGNYWDDWTSPDSNSDGIVDIPYLLAGSGAKDYYPLTTPHINNDTILPNIKINTPTDGSHIPNTFTLNVTASDNVAIDHIDMYINGSKIFTRSSSFEMSWTIPTNGIYSLEAIAYDTSNNNASDNVQIYVNMSGGKDTEKPFVKITSPANGTTITSYVEITASISDNVKVAEGKLLINSAIYLNVTDSFMFRWEPSINGTYTIEVTATDTSGNIASDSIIVYVNLSQDNLHHIDISPTTLSINVGNSTIFIAQAYDNSNKLMDNITYSWSLYPNFGSLNYTKWKSITFTATTIGSAVLTVCATSNGLIRNATATITITTSSSQSMVFSILGNVTDSDDRVMIGVNVTLSPSDFLYQQVVTNNTGGYIFTGLSANKSYTVILNVSGYESYKSHQLTSQAGKNIIYNIKLKRIAPKTTYPISWVVTGLIIIIVVACMSMFVIPALYTRIRRERVLDHFVRGQVYDHIRKNPGTYYNEMKIGLHLTNGTLGYHLRTLEKQGFIKSKRDGLYRRFYEIDVATESGEGIKFSEIQQKLINKIKKKPGLCQSDLAEELDEPLSVINYNVRALSKAGVVRLEKGKFGKQRCYIAEKEETTAS